MRWVTKGIRKLLQKELPMMAYSDRTYVGMGPGPGLGLIQCQSIGPI